MYKMLTKPVSNCIIAAMLLCNTNLLQAQTKTDTLRLSINETEKRFIDSNLVLLAAHYNIDANKALIEQAKLWDNPVLSTDQNIYADGKFFEHGKDNATGQPTGQYFIQVQQLIKTAGKRGKLINLATTNAKLSELQLNDVLRNLRYQLRQDYFTILQQLKNKKIAENSLVQLNRLLVAQEAQLKAGNIAEKDYLRIQAVVISLQQDLLDMDKSIADNQNDLKTLLQIKGDSFIYPTETDNIAVNAATTADELFNVAKQNNAYYQLQQTQTLFQQQNLVYQKSLRSPDLTIGTEYDHNSNYAPHYVGLSISLPLPIFNKNQGNIKSAGFAIKQQETIVLSAETELRNNITGAYNKLLLTLQQNNEQNKAFYTKYQNMFKNMLQSYQQKQIGLLEFLDFFDAYKDAELRQVQQQLNLQLAKEEVNYHVGTNIIK